MYSTLVVSKPDTRDQLKCAVGSNMTPQRPDSNVHTNRSTTANRQISLKYTYNQRRRSGSILSVESNQNVESKIAFGQLILRKIIKTVATRCQILRGGEGSEGRGWEGTGGVGREGSVVEYKKILKIV